MRNHKISLAAIYVVLSLLAVFSLLPILYAVIGSFKPQSDLFEYRILGLENFMLGNYIELFSGTLFPRWLFNSVFVALSFSVLTLFICSLGGYAFAGYKFFGKNILFFITIGSMTIPVWATVVPLFQWFARLRLINTYWSLILPSVGTYAFGIFLMRQYIGGIPSQIFDSARIDGCSEFQIYYRIVLPVIKPVLAALGIFAYLDSWNNFIYPLVFISTPRMFTIPVGLSVFVGYKDPRLTMLMAGGVIGLIPVLIIFSLAQKQFITGLTAGAVKG